VETFRSLFPTAEHLLTISPEDLAPVLLRLTRGRRQGGGIFWPESITQERSVTGEPDTNYPYHKKAQVEALVNEAWGCLHGDGLIMPAPDSNGRNGYWVFTKAGEEAAQSSDAFERVRAAKTFPKALLHPTIADQVWSALMRGDLDEAVFKAFKAVEVAVRSATGYAATDFGVALVRKAFHPDTGPLTRASDAPAERQARPDCLGLISNSDKTGSGQEHDLSNLSYRIMVDAALTPAGSITAARAFPPAYGFRSSSGSLAMLIAIRRASSRVSNPAAVRRPGSLS